MTYPQGVLKYYWHVLKPLWLKKTATRGEASREKQANPPILLKYYKRVNIKTYPLAACSLQLPELSLVTKL